MYHSFPLSSIVPLSRLVAAAPRKKKNDRREQNSGRTYGYVTGKVIVRTYPPEVAEVEGHRGTAEDGSPEFYYPCFLSSPGGGDRFFLLAVIFHWRAARDARLLSVSTDSARRVLFQEGNGNGGGEVVTRTAGIAIFRPHPLYFTPLIPTP